jgi:hypothetical protein
MHFGAWPFYALLKDEDEIEKVFGECVVSATPPQ